MADYIVLAKESFNLGENQEKTLQFTVPSYFHPDSQPLLAYIVNPSSDEDLAYEIDVNDEVMRKGIFSSGVSRGFWVVFDGSMLKTTAQNTIQFRVENGSGSVSFSDVVVWFQRNVTA